MGLVEDVQVHLQGLGIVDGSTGWPSVKRRVHDASDQLVIITEDGGFEPEVWSPTGIGDSAFAEPAVQCRVRGEKWDSEGAQAKAVEIFNALHSVLREMVGYTQYIVIRAQTAEPVFIGFDERDRPGFTISFRALRSGALAS